jgi:phosphoglycerate dehydrogenase-like enzyme
MSHKPKVIFGDIQITPAMEAHFQDLAGIVEFAHTGNSTTEAIARAKPDARFWVSRTSPVTAQDLASMRKVKMLSAWGVGYDHIDVPAATALSIPVCINPFFSRSVAEATLTLMFALAKRLRCHMQDIANAGDRGHQHRGTEIQGKTLGVVGFGRIGRELGDLASRLDMCVVACDPYVQKENVGDAFRLVTLDQLLSESDFVVLTTALTSETRYMIDAAELARMKPSAYLINVGRGGLVNESALLSALQRQQIAGAGLDVWEKEPVSPDHPLLALENVVGTPHRLAATWESLERVCRGIANNIQRVLNGQPPINVVNPEVIASRTGA